jgi:hypothetical protein
MVAVVPLPAGTGASVRAVKCGLAAQTRIERVVRDRQAANAGNWWLPCPLARVLRITVFHRPVIDPTCA